MQRPQYAIPLFGLALTGCPDPIIGEWDLEEIAGYSLPATASYCYYGYCCDVTIRADPLMVSNDLSAHMSLKYDIDCGFGYYGTYTYNYSGNVSVFDRKVSYYISLDGSGALDLDCSMQDKAVLSCYDDWDYVWVFRKY